MSSRYGPINRFKFSPAYIAGVTNPIFEALGAWDLLLDIGTGTVTVAKDIHTNYPVSSGPGFVAPLITRSGTLKAESSLGSEEDYKVPSKDKADFVPKADNNTDTVFIEDVCDSTLPIIEYA